MDPDPAQTVGSRIVGRYVIHGEIAHGGMATVHFGRLVGEVGFSRTVAVKSLHAQYAKDPEFKSMFLDEARLCARVRHPNVVPILDVVALEGELFMVMEYVQGETLSRLIRVMRQSSKRIPLRVVSAIMTNALEGLHAAHEAVSEQGEPLGIVHRDVSPQNIMVGVDGVARVLDFGVAKAAGRLQSTRDGQLKGKLPYMAPEQLRGTRIDRRTDVYAAGAVLWEALTGRRLFDAEDEVVIFGKVLESAVEPPSRIVPSLPRSLDEVCLKGLAREPDRRFQTAQEMAIALERAVGVAIPREVGRWVEQTASGSLKKRAEKIAELESVSSVNIQSLMASSAQRAAEPTPPPAPVVSVPSTPSGFVPPGVQTDPSLQMPPPQPQELYSKPSQVSMVTQAQLALALSQQQAQHGAKSPIVLVAAIVAAVLVFFAAAAALIFVRTQPGTSAASGPATTAAIPVASTPAVAATPTPPPVVSSAPEVSTSAPVATARPPVAGTGTGANTAKKPPAGGATAAPPATTAAPPPKADCNPPYTLDSNGVRIPKPQCL